ncbi:MAG: hypothetical protein LQ349_008241 [Xanthoria aureola]|nr:MAG: hypothetical protein LQ349_008241 [Xanthoria aureola]
MGHSPITALNIRVLLPTFPSPPSTSVPETDLPLPLPPTTHPNLEHHHQQQEQHPNPTHPPISSSSLESLITYPHPHHSPPTVSSSSSYSSSTTSSSSSTTSSPTTHKTFKWPSLPIPISLSSPKNKTPKTKIRRSTSTTMRCGRHGDEWLGVRGWRFWR